MTERVCLYNEVHKGLRSELLTLLMDCGRTDPTDSTAVGGLATRFGFLRGMLEEHAGHEEQWVEPLLVEVRPELAVELHAEHKQLDDAIAKVADAFQLWEGASVQERRRGGRLAHSALASFVGAYLSHMSREEDEAMPALQAALTDQRLLGVSVQLRGSIPPPRMAEFIAVMLPAMNIEERSQMFTGLKTDAPAPVLQGMCALAARVLAPSDWSTLQARVGL